MKKAHFPQLLFADKKGKVYDVPHLEASGMKAGRYFRLDPEDFVRLPDSSELFMLPDRAPVGFDPKSGETVELDHDPYSAKNEPCFAVAAFIPPGYTVTHHAAYHEHPGAQMLPLFAYAACALYQGHFYAAAVRVDEGTRHDERFIDAKKVAANTVRFAELFPKNRLIPHLTNCATVNGCANAKNFFLGRFEAPIPTSPVCNAQCQGCISLQPEGRIPSTQARITFTPTSEEIAELALFHIAHEKDPIVSFGQGCEGEPSLSADVIEKSIRLIRRSTSQGILNMNTNASRPGPIARLFEAGLNSIRVSLNSVREPYYSRYYQPRGYSLKEVIQSVDAAKKNGGFVSVNYLSVPGFTDSEEEAEAFLKFIRDHGVDMVQWRNLNYDPLHYFKDLQLDGANLKMLGMRQLIQKVQKTFPGICAGYFNPRRSEFDHRHVPLPV